MLSGNPRFRQPHVSTQPGILIFLGKMKERRYKSPARPMTWTYEEDIFAGFFPESLSLSRERTNSK